MPEAAVHEYSDAPSRKGNVRAHSHAVELDRVIDSKSSAFRMKHRPERPLGLGIPSSVTPHSCRHRGVERLRVRDGRHLEPLK